MRSSSRFALALVIACEGAAGADPGPGPGVRYLVDVAVEAETHHAVVAMTVAEAPAPLELSMPVWTPGAYERRDWGRNVVVTGAVDGTGRALAVRRAGPGGFRVEGHSAGAAVTVRYRVAADLLSDDASQIDRHHAYLNGTSLFLRAHGRDGRPHRVQLVLRPGARLAAALEGGGDGGSEQLGAPSYEALVDAPIEASDFSEASTRVDGTTFRVVIDALGGREPVPQRLLEDVAKLARAEAVLAGPPPYARYLLLIHLADGPGRIAALEHAASASIIVPRRSLGAEQGYQELLYVVAHELFHAWNARRLRPAELVPLDFDRPQPSRALWITEGLTEYFAHRAMRMAGLWSEERYLIHLGEEAARVYNDGAVAHTTLEEEAELTWHPPDEADGDPDAYYARGHLAALALDLAIRARSGGAASLATLLRRLLDEATRRGGVLAIDTDVLGRAAAAVAGAPLDDRLAAWARGAGAPVLDAELAALGLALEVLPGEPETGIGVAVEVDHGALRVAAVLPDGPAARAGLHAGDRVVAVDGQPPPARWPNPLSAVRGLGEPLRIEVVRAARQMVLPVAPETHRVFACRLVPLARVTPMVKRLRDGWLSPRTARRGPGF